MEMRKTNSSFALGYNSYKMFWVFLVCSFIGYAFETIYAVIRFSHLESHAGVIYGPFSEIYGFSAVIMVLLLHRVHSMSIYNLFFGCAIIGAVFEFICSLFQQTVFGYVSWDYSLERFNIFGRTGFFYGLIWGVLGVFLIKFLYPLISRHLEKLPNKYGLAITWLLILFMVFDLSISAAATYRANQRFNHIPATNDLQVQLDKYYPDTYIKKIYPNIIYGK